MTKRIYLIVSAVCICLSIFIADGQHSGRVYASESNRTMQVSVDIQNVEKVRITELLSSGYDVIAVHPGDAVEIIASTEEHDRLIAEGYRVTVSIPDLEERLESLYGRSTGLGLLSAWHSYDETVQELLTIQSNFPDITLLEIIGTSIEGRDIYAMKVSDNADIDEDEPEVLFTGLHHAREPITVEICRDIWESPCRRMPLSVVRGPSILEAETSLPGSFPRTVFSLTSYCHPDSEYIFKDRRESEDVRLV